MTNSSLGRGLSSLLGEENEGYRILSIDLLFPSLNQPRSYFDNDKLEELSLSIKEKGVLSPIIVRPTKDNFYEIIAGERRWRAAKKSGLLEVPVIIREFQDRESAEISLIENINREDLSPIEEAEGYKVLIDKYNHTQDSLAKVLGKSRSYISNILRLIQLPDSIKTYIKEKRISVGYARALIGLSEKEALEIINSEKSLSVRELEKIVRIKKNKKLKKQESFYQKNDDIIMLEKMLSQRLDLKVEIVLENDQEGKVSIFYNSLESLDKICQLISRGFILKK